MDLSSHLIGTYTNRKLQQRTIAALVTIGRDVFTRADLAHVDCFNFQAAATLSLVVNKHLQVKDTRDVFDNYGPEHFAIPRLGEIAILVLGACFEIKRIGGETPLDSWVRRHLDKGAAVHTFSSYKARADDEAAAARGKSRRRR